MTKYMALITFETQAIEDRVASNETGHWVGKDVDIAHITPIGGGGGRLVVEKQITPDLLTAWKNDPERKHFHEAYLAWKEGVEAPVNGQDLKNWPPISPVQLKQLNLRNIRSVEELAELPDDGLSAFGPGFRMIRDKAREWIKSSSDIGKVVNEVGLLKEQVTTLLAENAKKETVINQLLDRLAEGEANEASVAAVLTPKRPGRPSKQATAA